MRVVANDGNAAELILDLPEVTGTAGQVVSGNPIINDPFAEPTRHWHFSGLVPEVREGRRTAGYLAASPDGELKITDEIIGFEVVNDIRDRVRHMAGGWLPRRHGPDP